MTPQAALRVLGAASRGLRIERALHAAPGKRSYLVARSAERFVLRVDEPDAPDLGLDRRAEARVLRAVCAAGVGPALVARRLQAPAVFLLRYAPGRAWTAADLDEPRRLVQLAALLREVHAVDTTGLPHLDLAEAAARYARVAACAAPTGQGQAVSERCRSDASRNGNRGLRRSHRSQSMPARRGVVATPVATGSSRLAPLLQLQPGADRSSVGATPVATLASQVRALLAEAHDPTAPLALCHNDPIAANVVGLRHPLLIDWEYAAVGEPLFDLAVIVEHHRLRARAARRLLAEYFGGAAAIPGDRLAHYRAVYRRILRIWQLALMAPARR